MSSAAAGPGLPGGLTPVIVGYGRAGSELHHRCLRAVAGGPVDVVAVDPVRPRRLPPDVRWRPSLAAALSTVDPERAVFHVATPVHTHLATVEALAAGGARRIVLEKPMAHTAADARRVAAVAAGGVQIVPVAVWPASTVTEHVARAIADGGIGTPRALHMQQSKPRFQRSRRGDAHRCAMEVELPHQLLLALHLAGPVAAVTRAAAWNMELPDGDRLPGMGGVAVTLAHTGGITSTLVSDLTSPIRIRRLRISGTAGRIVAHYPISGEDDVGQLHLPGRPGRTLVRDAPLTRFFDTAYRQFAGLPGGPTGDLRMHVRVVELLETVAARCLAGRSARRDSARRDEGVHPC